MSGIADVFSVSADLWWNPALENQAIDRAHRFGQTRAVDVYKFTIQDTVETRILELQCVCSCSGTSGR